MGNHVVFKSCGGILELQREIQTSSCVGPVKTNLPFELRGRDGCCSRVTVGQNRPHLGFCPGHNVPLQGQQGSRGCIPDSPEVRPRLEGKQSTLLSSQVATGISWSPLSGLKGVKPPVKFGERTRDCSPCSQGGGSYRRRGGWFKGKAVSSKVRQFPQDMLLLGVVLNFQARCPGLQGLFWEERHEEESRPSQGSRWASVAPTWTR